MLCFDIVICMICYMYALGTKDKYVINNKLHIFT